ncbi:MAG: hypothetical protein PUP91_30705, partial [Rhizonema sp. PD37]|nr:hypothetical protein [Rhizonema sp. PD37]
MKKKEYLFSGLLIRWSTLNQPEKVVVFAFLLIPIWWLWGWRLLFFFLLLGIVVYEYRQQKKVDLKFPSLAASSVILFGAYTLISVSVYAQLSNFTLSKNSIFSPIDEWICAGLILWYIQNKNIRVRLQVVAWSCSIIVLMMLVAWLIIYFGLQQAHFVPSRSIYGLLTDKGERFIPGLGNSNYLLPYFPTDKSLPGMVRYVYFFHGPESLALFVGFICLLALDIKNRLWSLLLFIASFFLLLTSGTRAVWVALPVVLFIRYFFQAAKLSGIWLLCVLIAIISYTTLSIPAVTDLVLNRVTNTTDATGNLRRDSTEVRAKIYHRTYEAIIEDSDSLIFGHVLPGKTVLPGYAPAMVGTHSFILSSLLYRSGLVGTGIFFTYWISLLWWLYQTRNTRPMCLLIFALFSLTFTTMEFETTVMPISLICVMLDN